MSNVTIHRWEKIEYAATTFTLPRFANLCNLDVKNPRSTQIQLQRKQAQVEERKNILQHLKQLKSHHILTEVKENILAHSRMDSGEAIFKLGGASAPPKIFKISD